MKKNNILVIVIFIFYNYPSFAQGNVSSPEQIAFNYFQDSLIPLLKSKIYFTNKTSGNCSLSALKISEFNLDTCFNQNSCLEIEIKNVNPKLFSKRKACKKWKLKIDSACTLSENFYIVNIILGNRSSGNIFHIFILNNKVYMVKKVAYIT